MLNVCLLIVGLILVILGTIFTYIAKSKWYDWEAKKVLQVPLIVLGLLLVVLSSSFKIIPTGYTGVKTTFGQINKSTISNGFNWKIPFVQLIDKVNNKQQDISFDSKVWSETSNRTAIYFENITVTYQINPEKSAWIYANIDDYEDNLINQSIVASSIKSSSKNLTDVDATNRSIIEPMIMENLQKSLDNKYGERVLVINKVIVNNADFEDSYNKAIADKQKAQLEAEKQGIQNKKAIEKAEADAKVKIKAAEANAQAKKIAANAEAESNEKINKSLSGNILKNKLYDKWNGELPKVEGSNGSLISFDDLGTNKK